MHGVEMQMYREFTGAGRSLYMPASSTHFTIVFLAKILRTKTRCDFRFLATAREIIDNILIVPEFI